MTVQYFIQKLNWRQILVHAVATWFFIYAFQLLAYLYNTTMYDGLQKLSNSNDDDLNNFLKDKGFTMGDLILYFYYATAVWLLGLFVAFLISLSISRRKNWFWANALIVSLLMCFLRAYDLLGWSFLKTIFLAPGEIFKSSAHYTALYLLTNGTILLALGIFTFSNRRIIAFIDRGNLSAQHAFPA